MSRVFKWLSLSVVVIIFDQLTKYWAEHILKRDTVDILPVLDFSLVHNTGAAFGFLGQYGGCINMSSTLFISFIKIGTIHILILRILLFLLGRHYYFVKHLGSHS